ncbi:MAG: GAF and ANTAR domain-containing protein [Actinomycetota bacterium]|nr:GAF and ANTAR domain-containing protein [Actinomycetota bacterium]
MSTVLRAVADADVDGVTSLVDQVCVAAVGLLALRGAGLSLMVDGNLCGSAGTSDSGIVEVQELQLTLGQGPCVDAWTTRAPVSEADLAHPMQERWPVFAQAAVQAGVLAVFALPLHLGAIRIGVLVLYRDRPGALSADELGYGLVLADVATHVVLGLQTGAPHEVLHEALAREPAHWAEIHQATGIVSVQLNISLSEAFVRLRAHSFAKDRLLREVGRDVVSGRLRLGGGA